MFFAWIARLVGVDKSVVVIITVAVGVLAAVGGAAYVKHSIEQTAIARAKAKENADAIRRTEEAIAKSREFQRDVDAGADVDCLLYKRGWLAGPMPSTCQ